MDSLQAQDVFSAADGTVVGPYRADDSFKLYKVIGDDTKEEASVQHILLSSTEENETIAARADSVLKALKRGADFDELASKYSEDPGYAQNKGLYENFGKGQMVPEFESFAFEKSVGSMGVVKTSFGYHVMEVLDRVSAPQKKVVELVKFIRPSSNTLDVVYEQASNFSIDNSNLEKFRSSAEAKGYTIKPNKGVLPSAKVVGGIPESRSITRWAYNAERSAGDVSQPMEFADQFVVVALTGSREEGIPSFEDVKEKMKAEVIKEKKADMIIAELGDFNGLAGAAEAWGVTSKSSAAVSLSNAKLGGNEPAVVSKAFAAESGSVVGPVRGNQGIFVVQVDSKNEIDLASVDLANEVRTLQTSMRGTVGSKVNNALNKAKGVKNEIDRIY
jgi:peptidyl-prolyl cis-trans isomerase D